MGSESSSLTTTYTRESEVLATPPVASLLLFELDAWESHGV